MDNLTTESRSFDHLVERVKNDDHAALESLKRDYPPTGLDEAVVEYFDIVAFDPTTRRVLVEDDDGVANGDYDSLAVCFYGDAIDPWDGAEILAQDIERYVESGGTFDGDWDGLDIVPIEGGWRITVLAGDDEGTVIVVKDGKVAIVEGIEVVPQGEVVQMREWKFRTLVNNANTSAAALDRLKRDYPVPDSLDGYVVFVYDIIAYDHETGVVACDEIDVYAVYVYGEIARSLYKGDIDQSHYAEDMARSIEHYVRLGGTLDRDWDGLDVTPIDGGWRIEILVGPDEGAVIKVVDGKATLVDGIEVEPPSEEEMEQIRLSLTRPHDGGVPI